MQQIRKMGSLSKIMGMLPGMGQFRDQLENFDEREIDRIQAIIQSMTPAERANPKIIDGSRRVRISRGSGTQVSDVNSSGRPVLRGAQDDESMAKGGGCRGMPGMPGLGGGKRGKAKQAAQEGQGQAWLGQPGEARSRGEGARRSAPPSAGNGAAAEPRSDCRPAATRNSTPPRSTCRRTSRST